jgi:hypothetical protein
MASAPVQSAAPRVQGEVSPRVNGFLRALDGAAAAEPREPVKTGEAAATKTSNGEAAKAKPDRRASLIERITRAEKPVA